MDQGLADTIAERLPLDVQFRTDWVLAFSPRADGAKMETFYASVAPYAETVVLVSDTDDHVFGCFVPSPWREGASYFGPGPLVFTFRRGRELAGCWAAKAPAIQWGTEQGLVLGGGTEGTKALALDKSWTRGESRTCAMAFDNEPLGGEDFFAVRLLEVW